MRVLNRGATFNEFTLELPKDAADVVQTLMGKGIAAGVPLGEYYAGMANCLVVTVTEKRSRGEIEALAEALEASL